MFTLLSRCSRFGAVKDLLPREGTLHPLSRYPVLSKSKRMLHQEERFGLVTLAKAWAQAHPDRASRVNEEARAFLHQRAWRISTFVP